MTTDSPTVIHLTASEIVDRYTQSLRLGFGTAESFANEYIGSRIDTTFVVGRIYPLSYPRASIHAKEHPLICYSAADGVRSVHSLAEGDTIRVIGRIQNIGRTLLFLEDCELLSLSIPVEDES